METFRKSGRKKLKREESLEKKRILLYNPESGRGTFHVEEVCSAFREGGWDIEPVAVDFTKNAFEGREDTDMMVVAGGDGSLNYALNCMKQKGLDLPLAILPVGTANDFAGILKMSSHPMKAVEQILHGKEERLDCGRVNDTWFINIFSFGIFTTTSEKTPDEVKHKFGNLAYIIYGFKEIFHIHRIPLHIEIERYDNHAMPIDTDVLMALIFNGRTAGRHRFVKDGDPRDGLLDVVLVKNRGLLLSALSVFYQIISGHKSLHVLNLQCSTLDITSKIDEPTDIDGQAGPHFPLHIECVKGGVRMIVPDTEK